MELINLNKFPGIYTKRFLDKCGSCIAANKKLQEMLQGKDSDAKFVCASAIFDPTTNEILHSQGEIHGKIIFENIAKTGFAYDTMFVPEGYNETFTALGNEIKLQISHRAQAIKNLIQLLLQKIND